MTSAAARVPSQAPLRWTSTTASKSASDILRRVASRVMPALLTITSREPNRSTQPRTAAFTASASVTSQVTAATWVPVESRARALASAAGPSMSAMTTRAPFLWKAVAMARPIPLAAPVTRALLPCSMG